MSDVQQFSPVPKHIPSLDGLRAVSIILVFLSHVGISSKIPGGFGVTVFFFLSGYLITELLTREWDSRRTIALKAFFKRRLLRLTPPLIMALILGYGLLLSDMTFGNFDWATLFAQTFYFENYLLAATNDMEDGPRGLTILWSLAVEEHFYMIWPFVFVAFAAGRLNLWHLAALSAAILIWRIFLFDFTNGDDWAIYTRTDTRFDSIMYGCLLALLCWRGLHQKIFAKNTSGMIVTLGVAFAVLIFCFLYRDDTFRSTFRYTLQGLALMPIFFYAIYRPDFIIFRPLNWTVSARLGLYSYNFYLAHYVLISAFRYNGLFEDNLAVFVAMTFFTSLVYAIAVYHIVESPIRAIRRNMKPDGDLKNA